MNRGILGLRGQGMSGRKRPLTPASKLYPPGSHTFTPTKSGFYRFVLWGAGAAATNTVGSGASGAFIIAERNLAAGQSVAISVGKASGNSTTATFPDGEILSAQGGQSQTGGTATANTRRGDTATNGTDGTLSGGSVAGANAPGTADYVGGDGAPSASGNAGETPGGGGATNTGTGSPGGDGLALVVQVKIAR